MRLSVVRGKVTDASGSALAQARVSLHGQPDLGWVRTRSDGRYDLVVNGGAAIVLSFDAADRLPAQRHIRVAPGEYADAPTVSLIAS